MALRSFATQSAALRGLLFSQRLHLLRSPCRAKSTANDDDNSAKTAAQLSSSDHWITSADHGRTIVCYHPERDFPYEHSLPMPESTTPLDSSAESALRVQLRADALDDGDKRTSWYNISELASLFDTVKYDFLPTPRQRRRERYHPHLKPLRKGL